MQSQEGELFMPQAEETDCLAQNEPLRIVQMLLISEVEYQKPDAEEGLVLVGSVILNRLRNPKAFGHAGTIEGIIKDAPFTCRWG